MSAHIGTGSFCRVGVIRIALLLALSLATGSPDIRAQQASASPAKPAPSASPISIGKIPLEAESTLNTLQQIETSISAEQSTLGSTSSSLSALKSEIEASLTEDTRILAASPSLDLLYRLKATWHNFDEDLSASAQELTRRATGLEGQIMRLAQLQKTWQATLPTLTQPNIPSAILERAQTVAGSIERVNRTAESSRAEVLTLQSDLSGAEDKVRTALSSIDQSKNRALRGLLVRDSPLLWRSWGNFGDEWRNNTAASFSSQLKAASVFARRLPLSFAIHGIIIVLIAVSIQWMAHRLQRSGPQDPDWERATRILGLPISAAFLLSFLVVPTLFSLAPRFLQAVMGLVAMVPTVLILRRLLQPRLFPVIYALVASYFLGRLQVPAASLPHLNRLLFLVHVLAGFLFLVWLIRGERLQASGPESTERFLKTIRAIVKIGLVAFPTAFLTSVLGYTNLANLVALTYLRSSYLAAVLYSVIRILDGIVFIVLKVRPLSALRGVQLHGKMLHDRTCHLLEFLAFLFWLDRVLDFFGLRDPLIEKTVAVLNANLAIGSINISAGRILAFVVAVWVSFLVSKFLRFVLEQDVYQHLRLGRGIPHAVSTILHYVILLLGFFVALGALGIDLGKITILAGAFSVGVGFGLQNVINNFVSGLILLFERPIKIGDIIDVGGNAGEVRRIGIRGSVIRTADGSEIIVPNGSLISSQVTNWTFSDRQRGVEVSVNVAAGTDPQRVVELLKSIAARQPGLAKQPAPQVYVVNFSAGAMTFQLRAWTDRYEDWAQLRSDLSVGLNEALIREKIAIA